MSTGRNKTALGWVAGIVLFLAVVLPTSALAQEQAELHTLVVLPAAFGEGEPPAEWVDGVESLLHARADLVAFDRDEAAHFVTQRYPEPQQIDLPVFLGLLDAGEDAFYEMHFDESWDHLTSQAVQTASEAHIAMGSNPALADAVRRALLARARTAMSHLAQSDAEDAIRESLRLFPGYIATTDYYSPSFVDLHADVRRDFLQETHELRIVTPQDRCGAELNGYEIEGEGEIVVPVVDGLYAVRAICFGRTGRVHLIDASRVTTVNIDPAFDHAFRSPREGVSLENAESGDFTMLRRMARGYADILDVEQVWLVTAAVDDAWGPVAQIVQVDLDDGGVDRGVRVRQEEDGAFRLDEGIAVILDGQESDFAKRDIDGRWNLPAAVEPTTTTGGTPIGAFVLIGVGAAGLINGGIFAALENQTFTDYEACNETASCSGGQQASDLKADGERQRLVSLISFGVGASAAVAGVLWWLLSDQDPDARSDAISVGPVDVALSFDGIGLTWDF